MTAAPIRSFLFVPGDSERKLAKAASCGADALIVDLEDSVAPSAKPAARRLARDFVAGCRNAWVRINPFDTEDAIADLEAVMPARPAGIVLPKPRSAADAVALDSRLDRLEREHGLEAGQTRILPLVTERPEALFRLDGYIDATPRLAGLSWGAEDLGTALGASANRDADGQWLPPYALARSLCLLAAAAAGVPAVDTVYTDFRDAAGLAAFAARGRRDGFSGMLAIHPGQIDEINRTYMPSAAEIEHAERIVAAFRQNPGAGALSLDDAMIDRPHLLRAERILARAGRPADRSVSEPANGPANQTRDKRVEHD